VCAFPGPSGPATTAVFIARLPRLPGLRFVGLTNPLKGLLFQINLDARSTARAIARELSRSGGT
jgi:hypothetical protein